VPVRNLPRHRERPGLSAHVVVGQVWRSDDGVLFAVVAVQPTWIWVKHTRGYQATSRYGHAIQTTRGWFELWTLVTEAEAA
jgi:hypothetical protein